MGPFIVLASILISLGGMVVAKQWQSSTENQSREESKPREKTPREKPPWRRHWDQYLGHEPPSTYGTGPPDWHSIDRSGEFVKGKMGAMKYILDEDGYPITKGYHEFLGDETIGKIGASRGNVQWIRESGPTDAALT